MALEKTDGAIRRLLAAARARGRRAASRLRRDAAQRASRDKLVQGLQGLILKLQAIASDIPAREPVRERLEQVMVRAEEMLLAETAGGEGLALLPAAELAKQDLAGELRSLGMLFAAGRGSNFQVRVSGEPWPLSDIARAAAVGMVQEVLSNVFHLAQASAVILELRFEVGALTALVRDEGANAEIELHVAGAWLVPSTLGET